MRNLLKSLFPVLSAAAVAACASRPSDASLSIEAPRWELISPCRTHLLVRNRGTSPITFSVIDRSGTRTEFVAPPDKRPQRSYLSTLVMVPSEGRLTVWAANGTARDVNRSSTPCVRDLPAELPRTNTEDYTTSSATAFELNRDASALSGPITVTFKESASAVDINELIHRHRLAIVGGTRSEDNDYEHFEFWKEETADSVTTRQVIRMLIASPVVRRAMPFILPGTGVPASAPSRPPSPNAP